ncbi:unnamed protein product [Candidula unifasciata]|uniref:DUF885 domain-containing protein n=1 Tax=Candidula unifasciata TaxID=100452 RepID=A0A8S3YCB3_9EUPU|nr:unnamed protein product [Candidula unifasciata]
MLEREYFMWRLDDRPEFGSSVGYHKNSDRLEQFDLKLMTSRMEKAQSYLELLQEIDVTKLSKADKIDYTIIEDMLKTYVEGYEWRHWNNLSPLNWLEGNTRNPFYFVDSTPFDNRGDFENYIARLHEMPRLFEQYKTFMNEAIRLGRTVHKAAIDRVPNQINQILSTPEEESIYFRPFLEYLNLLNGTIPTMEYFASESDVVIIFHCQTSDLQVYMNHTRPLWGVGSLEGGKEFYKACVNWYLSLNMTPEDIHELGLKEVERLSQRMHEIREKQGYGGYSIREYFAELMKKDDMFLENQQDILAEYENIIFNRINPILNKLFKDQPGLPIKVESMHSDGPRGQYFPGTSDGMRPGTFSANTFRKVPKYIMVSLTMHEANPGHHLQISYELTAAVPEFRKNKEHSEKFRVPFAIPTYTAFVEGWALYAESLGVENNLYETDYELMGYYESEIFRAARLVVDTGLHYFSWTREKAINYFLDHTSESLDGIELEVDRYITWPGHAVAYKVGELMIRELRKYAEKELGQFFDVRDFHMVVLRNGAVPLSVLTSQVRDWVKNHRKEHENDSDDCDECSTTPDPTKRSRCQRSPKENEPHSSGSGVTYSQAFVILLFIRLTCILSKY